ncbi:MAG: multicopper oxidase domain-containing protein [Bacteroidota bacterium]|nr:multicopper oxidase domain-containing protein [Bacteroidota bacterium]MDP4190357.1 multicopper oxidase domain-containing protein [Bacteroidota bacterium]MDP4193515.1 multicopper oxidase domain-containing protein [Bacteroidota bacterium]
MYSRRDFLRTLGVAGAGLMIPWQKLLPDTPTTFYNTALLTKFKDPLLSAIPVAVADYKAGNITHYTLKMEQGTHRFHSEMPISKTWGYGGLGYFGPTVEARQNQMVGIKWVNNLPTEHIFEQDMMLLKMMGLLDKPMVRTCVHLHGAKIPEIYDGGPESWYASGQSFESIYPNIQEARQMWYHDHALGQTRLNAYAGLAGLWYIRDYWEDSLSLPKGEYEIPLIIQDKQFDINGQLFYLNPWEPEFFGDTILVNGTAWPKLEVEPRKYRFRMLNASQARFYNLYLDYNIPMHQIGSEGGLLPQTVQFNYNNQLILGCGERADVIIDFSKYNGKEIILRNTGLTPADIGDPPTAETSVVMKFIVNKPLKKKDTSNLPMYPRAIRRLSESSAVRKRNITLHEVMGMEDMWPGGMPMQLNNRPFLGSTPTETPILGTTEVWNFINLSPDTHPMHMHLINFQVLDRIPFDPEAYKNAYGNNQAPEGANLFTTGSPIPPYANEKGWKETLRCPANMITRVIANFDGFTGKYVYHCHILDHEENDMMQYMVVKPALSKDAASSAVVESFELHQNYPNPFNPSTTIQFQIPMAGLVEIKIFNSLGKEVTTLIKQDYEAGLHSVQWNGLDSFGFRVPSGVYLYVMKSGEFSETKKMVLLK